MKITSYKEELSNTIEKAAIDSGFNKWIPKYHSLYKIDSERAFELDILDGALFSDLDHHNHKICSIHKNLLSINPFNYIDDIRYIDDFSFDLEIFVTLLERRLKFSSGISFGDNKPSSVNNVNNYGKYLRQAKSLYQILCKKDPKTLWNISERQIYCPSLKEIFHLEVVSENYMLSTIHYIPSYGFGANFLKLSLREEENLEMKLDTILLAGLYSENKKFHVPSCLQLDDFVVRNCYKYPREKLMELTGCTIYEICAGTSQLKFEHNERVYDYFHLNGDYFFFKENFLGIANSREKIIDILKKELILPRK